MEVGESLEDAAIREAKEETSLDVVLTEQFHSYSRPDRDPRFHTVSVVFIGESKKGVLKGRDDARQARVFNKENMPHSITFDHGRIISDFFSYIETGTRPT